MNDDRKYPFRTGSQMVLALGANLPLDGDTPAATLEKAVAAIGRLWSLTGRSRFFRSVAWPDPADPPFVNAVIACEARGGASAALETLHAIEAGFSRRRHMRNAPRTLDLDLIDYAGEVCVPAPGASGPVLPHPRMHQRRFVVAPLAEFRPDWRHPQTGFSARQILESLPHEENDTVTLMP